jgi:hypothetical protein
LVDDSVASKPNNATGNRCKNLEVMGFIGGMLRGAAGLEMMDTPSAMKICSLGQCIQRPERFIPDNSGKMATKNSFGHIESRLIKMEK